MTLSRPWRHRTCCPDNAVTLEQIAGALARIETLLERPPLERPCGVAELAELLGVRPGTIHQWRQRDLGFPEPTARVGGSPAWAASVVLAWARATGRVPGGESAPVRGPSRP